MPATTSDTSSVLSMRPSRPKSFRSSPGCCNEKRKCLFSVVYQALASTSAVYLWHLDPVGAIQKKRIRLFNSLNSPGYNDKTLELLRGDDSSQITIATDKFSVGMNVMDFRVGLIIQPADPDDLAQKAGRFNRDGELDEAEIFVYYLAATMKKVAEMMKAREDGEVVGTQSTKKSCRKKKAASTTLPTSSTASDDNSVDEDLARLITAPCIQAELDRLIQNPESDSACSDMCTTCKESPPRGRPSTCRCSGCQPEPVTPPAPPAKTRKRYPPLRIRVTTKMREVASHRLEEFWLVLWEVADKASTSLFFPEDFLPTQLINNILDNLHTVLSRAAILPLIDPDTAKVNNKPACAALLAPFVIEYTTLSQNTDLLLEILFELHGTFDKMREETREDSEDGAEESENSSEAEEEFTSARDNDGDIVMSDGLPKLRVNFR
ncbi:hypothetical protein AAF712_014695 [Marasmius tenuissimus]|uniref:Helicase C-terminal domain-containing protein n=1 Tax=Marasmius tenuissimus TaxID=585030 RepID=A0ABR2ZBL5_9AGAR